MISYQRSHTSSELSHRLSGKHQKMLSNMDHFGVIQTNPETNGGRFGHSITGNVACHSHRRPQFELSLIEL